MSIQIIPEIRKQSFADKLMTGASRAAAQGAQDIPRLLMRNEENKELEKRFGVSLKGIHSPEVRNALISQGIKQMAAGKESVASIPARLRTGESQLTTPGSTTVNPILPGEQAPAQVTGTPQSKTQIAGQAQPQAIPEVGGKRPVLTPDQVEVEAANLVRSRINTPSPIRYEDALAQVQNENASRHQYQQYLENAGKKADAALEKIYPEASDEHYALLRRKVEQYVQQNLTPAELDRKLAVDAKNFKNRVASIKNSLPPKRFYTRAKEGLLGTGRSAEKTRDSIRLKVKPLLDDGLYDDARDLLSNVGYAPEERESIVSSLGEQSKKNLADFAPIKKGIFHDDPSYRSFNPGSEDQQRFAQNLSQTLQTDPATNLVLLRKAYEDRGVDWRSFKDELDNLWNTGQFQPNEDQLKAIDILDEPPLDRLDVLLHSFGFVGR